MEWPPCIQGKSRYLSETSGIAGGADGWRGRRGLAGVAALGAAGAGFGVDFAAVTTAGFDGVLATVFATGLAAGFAAVLRGVLVGVGSGATVLATGFGFVAVLLRVGFLLAGLALTGVFTFGWMVAALVSGELGDFKPKEARTAC